MSSTAPTIDFRDPIATNTALSLLTLTGTGTSGAIPTGTYSATATIRIYNNYSAATGIADAVNCTLASYDNATQQNQATTTPVLNGWLQVQVMDYNGTPTSQDTQFYALGGSLKHRIPVNNAVLGGSTSNYVTVQVQVVIPASATGSTITQGLWLECNFNL